MGTNGQIYLIAGYNPSIGAIGAVSAFDSTIDNVVMGDVSQATPGGPLVPSNTLPPGAVTQVVTAITPTSATLNATVYPEGTVTTFRFVYGAGTETQSTVVEFIGSGLDPVNVSVPISGLLPNTSYVFQVIATNSNGTTDSDTDTFTTTVASIQFSSATFRANVTDGTTELVITRSGDLTHAVTAVVSSAGGTDVTAFQQTVSFGPNVTNVSLAVPIANNGQPNLADLSIPFSISSPSFGAIVGSVGSASLVIHDNNSLPPAVTISSVRTTTIRIQTGSGKRKKIKTEIGVQIQLSGALTGPGSLASYQLFTGKTKKHVTRYTPAPLNSATYNSAALDDHARPRGQAQGEPTTRAASEHGASDRHLWPPSERRTELRRNIRLKTGDGRQIVAVRFSA